MHSTPDGRIVIPWYSPALFARLRTDLVDGRASLDGSYEQWCQRTASQMQAMRQWRRQREQRRTIGARLQRRARIAIARAGDAAPVFVSHDGERTCWFYVRPDAALRLRSDGDLGWNVCESDTQRGRVLVRFWATLGRWVGARLRYQLTWLALGAPKPAT
jgi:hypothetical protein